MVPNICPLALARRERRHSNTFVVLRVGWSTGLHCNGEVSEPPAIIIFLGRWAAWIETFLTETQTCTNGRMFAKPLAKMTCSVLRVSGSHSMIRKPAAAYTTSMDDFDLGCTAVCCAKLISVWFGDSVTVNVSFARTELVQFLLSRLILLKYTSPEFRTVS